MAQWVKNLPATGDTGDVDSIPKPGEYPGGGHGKPLEYSCLENPIDREAWQSIVHGVTKELDMTKCLSTRNKWQMLLLFCVCVLVTNI